MPTSDFLTLSPCGAQVELLPPRPGAPKKFCIPSHAKKEEDRLDFFGRAGLRI